jgi:hypothetical protein
MDVKHRIDQLICPLKTMSTNPIAEEQALQRTVNYIVARLQAAVQAYRDDQEVETDMYLFEWWRQNLRLEMVCDNR